MPLQSYRDLLVWQKSIELVKEIYTLTNDFPKSEIYGLASQMRRAAVSIPSNIAEGSRRGSRKDFRHFILNAYGSGAELETQLEIAKRLAFTRTGAVEKATPLLDETMRMLNKTATALKASVPTNYSLQTTNQ